MEEDPWGEEPSWARGDGGGDDDDEEDDDVPTVGASHILVMIDCNPTMFIPSIRLTSDEDESTGKSGEEAGAEGDRRGGDDMAIDENSNGRPEGGLVTPFEAALRATERLIRSKVNAVATSRGGTRDGIGVMLFATKKFNPEEKLLEGDDGNKTMNGDGGALKKSGEYNENGRPNASGDDSSLDDDDDDDDDGFDGGTYLTSFYHLIPLAPPGTEQTLQIRGCIPGFGGSGSRVQQKYQRDLEKEFAEIEQGGEGGGMDTEDDGINSFCPLRTALHEASKAYMEAKCVKKQAATSKNPGDSKSLWIFTNEDSPCKENENEKKQVVIVAKDAADNGLQINVWPLPLLNASSPFDRSKFYNDITTKDVYSVPSAMENTEEFSQGDIDLDELLHDIDRSWTKVRKASTMALYLPGWESRPANPGIMIDLIRPFQIKRKPVAVIVNQETNKRTTKITNLLVKDGDTMGDEIKDKSRLRHYSEFGGARAPFTHAEVDLLKQKANANEDVHCLILNGFKPMSTLPWKSFENTYFTYPNEEKVHGSSAAYTALCEAMLRKQVWGVGELLLRAKKASSRLVAMVPQEEVRDEHDGAQVTPKGITLFALPFEDDIRAIEEPTEDVADAELVAKVADLIKNQTLENVDFGASFVNPALTAFWNYIESIAIDIPLQEEDNPLELKSDAILANAGAQLEALKLALPEEEVKATAGRKRKAPTIDDSGVDWKQKYDTDSIASCNVATLKKYLGSQGEKVSGKKDDLVDRVQNNIAARIAAGTMPDTSVADENGDGNAVAEGNGGADGAAAAAAAGAANAMVESDDEEVHV